MRRSIPGEISTISRPAIIIDDLNDLVYTAFRCDMADRKPNLCELIQGLRESIPAIVNYFRTGLKPNYEDQIREMLYYTNHYRRQATEARVELRAIGIDPHPLKDFMEIEGQAKHPEYERRYVAVMQFLYDTWIEVRALERRRKAGGPAGMTTANSAAASLPSRGPAPARTKMTSGEANIMARAILREKPKATYRELVAGIGCSMGLVSKLPAWQAVQEERKKGRQPKNNSTVSLTRKLEQVAGTNDDPLAKLVAEQEADAEPSPLQDDAAADRHGAPRGAKVYRRP